MARCWSFKKKNKENTKNKEKTKEQLCDEPRELNGVNVRTTKEETQRKTCALG